MCGVLTPLREVSLRHQDLVRLVDSCVDIINYASWQFALVSMVLDDLGIQSSGMEEIELEGGDADRHNSP